MRHTFTQTLAFVASMGCAAKTKTVALALVPTPPVTPTAEAYGKILDSWVGADTDHLVQVWGSPNTTFPMTGGTLWTYVRSSSYTTSIYSTTIYNPLTYSLDTTTTGGNTVNLRCQTEFEVNKSNRIVRWRWSGNACLAVPEPEPIDCTGRSYAGRVYDYHSDGDSVSIILFLPKQNEEYTLTFAGRHLQYLDNHWSARQWVAVCEGSGMGPYMVLYPQKKFISVIE